MLAGSIGSDGNSPHERLAPQSSADELPPRHGRCGVVQILGRFFDSPEHSNHVTD